MLLWHFLACVYMGVVRRALSRVGDYYDEPEQRYLERFEQPTHSSYNRTPRIARGTPIGDSHLLHNQDRRSGGSSTARGSLNLTGG